MTRRLATGLGLAALALGMACRGPAAPQAAAPSRQPAVVHVTNDNWMDVGIYAVRDGVRSYLGSVTTCDTASFRIPWAIIGPGELQLQADPIGGLAVYTTDRIFVREGTHIELRVANVLAHSIFSVWSEEPPGDST
jgi:hypothetical protein